MNATPRLLPALLAAACLIGPAVAPAQIIDSEDGAVAGIPVNYTEAKTGAYTLPDPLTLSDGQPVRDARTWWERRRPEILRLLEDQQFGRVPGRPPGLRFEVTDPGTPAFDGKAVRRQVTIHFSEEHFVDLLIYLPAAATRPVPVLLQLGWVPNNLSVDDPGVKVGRRWDRDQARRVPAAPDPARQGPPRSLTVLPLVERGYATAVFNYTDVEPDAPGAIAQGIRGTTLAPGETTLAPDAWGAIAAWTWGISRVIDYLETDVGIDARRIAVTGASRLGKTVLWAGAREPRIACVIASISGEGGAALSRRNYGETVAHLVAPTRYPYQFAANYQAWAGHADEAPFDAHLLLALIAPRPLLLQTGSTDKWSDPYGEFLAAKAATPVYTLLGQTGIDQYSQPAPGKPILNTLGYVMHEGGHSVLPEDWSVFLEFLAKHLPPQT
ncbi:MAG: acetylxylan esterase [Opitutaceae bacterium]|nr:acetylxylan esterase [Opitutaceae bacterium]